MKWNYYSVTPYRQYVLFYSENNNLYTLHNSVLWDKEQFINLQARFVCILWNRLLVWCTATNSPWFILWNMVLVWHKAKRVHGEVSSSFLLYLNLFDIAKQSNSTQSPVSGIVVCLKVYGPHILQICSLRLTVDRAFIKSGVFPSCCVDSIDIYNRHLLI